MTEKPYIWGKNDRVISVASLGLAGLVAVAMYVRLYFGVDYADEGFHVAMPYRFALGDRPFIDELSFGLGFGFVAAPLYRPYIALFGTEAIVLFGRHLYWVLSLLSALGVWFGLKRMIPWHLAIAASILGVGFASANMPSLSYDNMGVTFFSCGLFLGVRSLEDRGWRTAALAGISHCLAAASYFPLALPVLFFAIMLGIFSKT